LPFTVGEALACSNDAATASVRACSPRDIHRAPFAARRARERAVQCALLRCVVGNPFRPGFATAPPRTPMVDSLARAIYEGRRFEDLPVLADALEEAGCTNEEVLSHCRGTRIHARGCWPVDALLGKE